MRHDAWGWLPGALTGLLSGGLLGSVIALAKVGPDRGKIVAEGASAAVIAMQASLTRLEEEAATLHEELEESRIEAKRWRQAYIEQVELRGC